jgi:hypothetical protein
LLLSVLAAVALLDMLTVTGMLVAAADFVIATT